MYGGGGLRYTDIIPYGYPTYPLVNNTYVRGGGSSSELGGGGGEIQCTYACYTILPATQ